MDSSTYGFLWNPLAYFPIFSLFISSFNCILAFNNRKTPGALAFLSLSIAIIIYSFGYALELVSSDLSSALFWDSFQFFGTSLISVSVCFLILQLSGNKSTWTKLFLRFLFLYYICLLMIVWIFPELIRSNPKLISDGNIRILVYGWEPLFSGSAIFEFLIIIGALFYLWIFKNKQKGRAKIQLNILLLGLLIPIFGSFFTLFGLVPFLHPKLDITPVTFAIACIIWSYGLFHKKILDLIPIGRDKILELLEDAVLILDENFEVIDSNKKGESLIGSEKLTENTQSLANLNYELFCQVKKILTSDSNSLDWKTIENDVEVFYNIKVQKLFNDSESYKSISVVLRDITERKIIEIKTLEERNLVSAILSTTNILFIVIDKTGKIIHFNNACIQVSGYSKEEIAGSSFWKLFPQYNQRFKRNHFQKLTNKFPLIFTINWKNKANEDVNILWEVDGIKNLSNQNEYIVFTGTDITKKVQAENQIIALRDFNSRMEEKNKEIESQKQKLEESLKKLKQAQNQMILSEKMASLGVLLASIAHEVNNPVGAITATTGSMLEKVSMLHRRLFFLISDLAELSPSNRRGFVELFLKLPKNSEMLVGLEFRDLKKELTKKLNSLNVFESEEIADSLLSVGIKEIPTRSLFLFTESKYRQLLSHFLEIASLIHGLKLIQFATKRVSKIMYALKAYSRVQNNKEKTMTNIQASIDTVLTLYQNQIRSGIQIEKEILQECEILGYPDDLLQIWTNLIHNALQAMNFKGILKIKVYNQFIEREEKCYVEIIDNGPGIPKEIQSKIFEPFFTTKELGAGTGLGLDIVMKVIERHKGTLELESEPGRTMFRVILPIH